MSINTCHTGDSKNVVIFSNERLLIFTKNCKISFPGNKTKIFSDTSKGSIYLTTHRIIFISNCQKCELKSLSGPLVNLRNIDVKQPIFGSNKILAELNAEPNGGFEDKINIQMTFPDGGAIEFAQALEITLKYVHENSRMFTGIVPYILPVGLQVQAPVQSYMSPYNDPFYNYVPQHSTFYPISGNNVFVYNMPPPYPGSQSASGTYPFIKSQMPIPFR